MIAKKEVRMQKDETLFIILPSAFFLGFQNPSLSQSGS